MGLNESSSSLIDVIFTNCINRVVCSGVLHVGSSDHSLIYDIVNYLQSLLSKGIPLKLTEIFAILTEKTFAEIFLYRIGLVPVMTRTFCRLTGTLNFLLL